jgi:integrase
MIPLATDITAEEADALTVAAQLDKGKQLPPGVRQALVRHLQPLEETARRRHFDAVSLYTVRRAIVRTIAASGTAYAVWDALTWAAAAHGAGTHFATVLDVAHSLGCIRPMEVLAAGVKPTNFARRLFGTEAVAQEQQRVIDYLCSIGYRRDERMFHGVRTMTSRLLICVGEGHLEAITADLLGEMLRQYRAPSLRRALYKIGQALHGVGILAEPARPDNGLMRDDSGIDPTWLSLAVRWHATSTLSKRTRSDVFGELRRTGRWLCELHPDVHAPSDWSRELAAEYVAAVNGWTVGAYAAPNAKLVKSGASLGPSTKDGALAALRRFFKDCRDWEWSEPRFDPQLAFATPRSVRAVMSRDPRVIADEMWAKLIWAGLNFHESDLPVAWGGTFGNCQVSVYPLAMFKAVAITWLFAGLRVDELVRLRVGCIRWQSPAGGPGAASAPEAEATCLLDVPVHKTGTSYTKPVDPVVGRFIGEWEAARPNHPHLPDPKTGELVPMLFCWRGRRLPGSYINTSLIPALCKKAGVPERDARGRITGHRARHTIASQLYNAKEPMSLYELQTWLGHRSPVSTQYYVRISPTKLTKAYKDAGYFARNVRAIKVLIDRESISSGAAAEGQPWQYFDLGHGYCTYNFFEQCRHRMACARCDFYLPKDSTQVQLLEAKANLQRMLIEIPLTDDERAAVEDGQAAVDRLLGRLADVATPAGPSPKQLGR